MEAWERKHINIQTTKYQILDWHTYVCDGPSLLIYSWLFAYDV